MILFKAGISVRYFHYFEAIVGFMLIAHNNLPARKILWE